MFYADVTKHTIHDVLESWLRIIYDTPAEYRVENVEVTPEDERDTAILSGNYIPSRMELENCFSTGPFLGEWVV